MRCGNHDRAAHFVHPVNFNDLESVRYVCKRYPIAAMITEPILQNIGVVLPEKGYLAGLRELADEFGFLLIFDEVKTGFRHALGGYAEISGVTPDLVTYGKAIANGFPLALSAASANTWTTSSTRTLPNGPSWPAPTMGTRSGWPPRSAPSNIYCEPLARVRTR